MLGKNLACRRLHKFISLADAEIERRAKQIIVDKQLYFSAPASFNDPFDCSPLLRFTRPDDKSLVEGYIRAYMRKRPGACINDALFAAYTWLNDDARGPDSVSYEEERSVEYREMLQNEVGVLCLTPHAKHPLMWAHYGNMHQGICVIFNGKHPFFETCHPVQYVSPKDGRPVVHFPAGSNDENIRNSLFSKDECWRYEDEWRQVKYKHAGGPGLVAYPADALLGVVLGAKSKPRAMELVKEWLAPGADRLSLYKLEQSPTSFRLEAKKVCL